MTPRRSTCARKLKGESQMRGVQESARRRDPRLALVHARDQHRVPVRVELAPSRIHDVAHVLEDLARRQLVTVLKNRLVRPVKARVSFVHAESRRAGSQTHMRPCSIRLIC